MAKLLRVLIVEDNEDDAELVLRELRRGGYEPVCVRVDTPDALKATMEGTEWDIVISDYHMPQFDALAALAIVREKQADLPFMIVTGTIGEDVAVDAMRAGVHDYFMKGNLQRLVYSLLPPCRQPPAYYGLALYFTTHSFPWPRRHSSKTPFVPLIAKNAASFLMDSARVAIPEPGCARRFP